LLTFAVLFCLSESIFRLFFGGHNFKCGDDESRSEFLVLYREVVEDLRSSLQLSDAQNLALQVGALASLPEQCYSSGWLVPRILDG
jgi:hypothetical protein